MESPNKKLPPKKWDLIILAFGLLLAGVSSLLFYLLSGAVGAPVAVVTQNGSVLYEIELSKVPEEYMLSLKEGVTLQVKPGAVCFKSSDCRSKLCVHSGELSKPGQCAVCLPTKTAVYIKGTPGKNAPDVISY